MLQRLVDLLFPPKCYFCRKLLTPDQTDLCHECRANAPVFTKSKNRYSSVARWTAVWYYKGTVRRSLLRYKFYRFASYAPFYGRMLAMKLHTSGMTDFDILTWIPVSRLRRIKRGYDQAQLLAEAVASELGAEAVPCLKKVRHNPAQSGLRGASRRRANVMNAYKVISPETVQGKRILLLDDILTTGATASECAKTLLTAGAKEVYFAAVALTPKEENHTDM